MSTVVTIQLVGHCASEAERTECDATIATAMHWFADVEDTCSRFDATSEVRRLSQRVGMPVVVSPMLFEALRFALAVSAETGGAFDPTVGRHMEAMGFNHAHRSDTSVVSPFDDTAVSFRDVELNEARSTVLLKRPLLFDLGAVAKGLAIDLASRALDPFEHYAIDAGGDQYFRGHNADDAPWLVGIRHPRDADRTITTLRVTDRAVCTSGDYERVSTVSDGSNAQIHHLLDARTGTSASALSSVTVLAPTAMVADALATAAFVLGPVEGGALLQRHGVDALLITSDLECLTVGTLPYA